MARRPFRGVSIGTILTLALTAVTLIMGAFIYVRISGEPGELAASVLSLSKNQTQQLSQPNLQDSAGQSSAIAVSETAVPQVTASPVPHNTPQPERTLRLTAAGQIQIGTEMRNGALQSDGSFSFPGAFGQIAGEFNGDINIATLRSALASDVDDYGNYNAPDEIAGALRQAGVNLLNLGTDRILDLGVEGLAATRAALMETQLLSVGAYTTLAEAESGVMLEVNGIRVGVVSCVQEISSTGEEKTSETEMVYAVRDLEQTLQDVRTLRSRGAQVIIALTWWGSRGQTEVSEDMRQTAQTLADAGVDVVLGGYPSRVLPFERIQRQDGQETFVAYSLGNFLSDESRETQDIVGTLVQLELKVKDGRNTIVSAEYVPTWIMRYRNENGAYQYGSVAAGSTAVPENMNQSVYENMQKAYVRLIERLGTGAAVPAGE